MNSCKSISQTWLHDNHTVTKSVLCPPHQTTVSHEATYAVPRINPSSSFCSAQEASSKMKHIMHEMRVTQNTIHVPASQSFAKCLLIHLPEQHKKHKQLSIGLIIGVAAYNKKVQHISEYISHLKIKI